VSAAAGAGAARASLALAAALGAAALAPQPEWIPCDRPGSGRDGEVACDGGAPLADGARLVFGLRIDANQAGSRTLEALPGIGPALALAWVRERERAPFCKVADLDRVPGIGPSRVRGLAPWLEFRAAAACGPERNRLLEAVR
jgi:hypothetical protein